MLLGALKAKAPLLPTLRRGALACAIVIACLAPWTIRNYAVFHTFIPMRGNLGAELHQSILEEHQGFPWGATIPVCEVCPVFQQYRQMGEAAYVRREGELAKQEIGVHKLRFVEYSLKRFYFFWVSLPKPAEKGVLIEAVREMNYFFVSLAALLGLAPRAQATYPGRRPVRVGLRAGASHLLLHHGAGALPPSTRTHHDHPRRLPLPVSDEAAKTRTIELA